MHVYMYTMLTTTYPLLHMYTGIIIMSVSIQHQIATAKMDGCTCCQGCASLVHRPSLKYSRRERGRVWTIIPGRSVQKECIYMQ